jgi:protein phosphatase
VVADGMGGHAAGEEASSIAVETIDRCLTPEQISRVGNGDAQAVLSQVLEEASAAILGTAAARPEFKGMGSTAVVAVLADSTLHVCNVGDSRAYLIRGTEPSLLTVDHSVAAILAEMGNITPEEARSHPRRNELTASLGLERAVEPAYSAVPLQPGDRVVLCSDGLWDMLQDSEIACVSSDFTDPRTAVWDLIRAANEAGGHDNITAVVIFIGADCAKAEPLILQEEALPA